MSRHFIRMSCNVVLCNLQWKKAQTIHTQVVLNAIGFFFKVITTKTLARNWDTLALKLGLYRPKISYG
jgi:hypothetical protein